VEITIYKKWSVEAKCHFALIEIVGISTKRLNPRIYWSILKTGLKAAESQLETN
jgi:hypothetical protein